MNTKTKSAIPSRHGCISADAKPAAEPADSLLLWLESLTAIEAEFPEIHDPPPSPLHIKCFDG